MEGIIFQNIFFYIKIHYKKVRISASGSKLKSKLNIDINEALTTLPTSIDKSIEGEEDCGHTVNPDSLLKNTNYIQWNHLLMSTYILLSQLNKSHGINHSFGNMRVRDQQNNIIDQDLSLDTIQEQFVPRVPLICFIKAQWYLLHLHFYTSLYDIHQVLITCFYKWGEVLIRQKNHPSIKNNEFSY